MSPQLLYGFESFGSTETDFSSGSDGDGNSDLGASYDKEESSSKDEDLESPRASAC